MLDVREYQIIQEDNTRFRILLEPLPGQKLDQRRADKIMQQQLRDYDLDRTLDVTLETVDRLATDGESKFKHCITDTEEDEDTARPKESELPRQRREVKTNAKIKSKRQRTLIGADPH